MVYPNNLYAVVAVVYLVQLFSSLIICFVQYLTRKPKLKSRISPNHIIQRRCSTTGVTKAVLCARSIKSIEHPNAMIPVLMVNESSKNREIFRCIAEAIVYSGKQGSITWKEATLEQVEG